MAKDMGARIAAEISWSRTADRSARTRSVREALLRRFEREVDPHAYSCRDFTCAARMPLSLIAFAQTRYTQVR